MRVVVAAVVLAVSGCASPVETPTGIEGVGDEVVSEMPRLCVEGCLDEDPDSLAAGYFFPGTENQWEHCASGDIDQDSDGLDDDCEYLLAVAFRPLLSVGIGDDVNREPRWAAKWLNDEAETYTVRIAYLPSYWVDLGLPTGPILTACLALGGGFQCGNHAGDSEWISLDVKYYAALQHWVLVDAYFSAHEWHVPFKLLADTTLVTDSPEDNGGGGWFPAAMQYPDKKGGYPRVYVADRKHANYPSDAYCDSHGGIVHDQRTNYDNCDSQRTTMRLEVPSDGNIGSRGTPFINCVLTTRSDHPSYGSGRTECYWTVKKFAGWFPADPAVSAGEYSLHLNAYMDF
jgi:hypothetical protein